MTPKQMIAHLNDLFRQTGIAGKMVMTRGVADLDDRIRQQALLSVRTFSNFTEDNDPHGEHDFGSFAVTGQKFFWKIDYYDNEYKYGSKEPWDVNKTKRVLTIMLASEY